MQNINSGAAPPPLTGHIPPSDEANDSPPPAVAALPDALPTGGLKNPQEEVISTHEMESKTNRHVELMAQGALRNEVNGAFRYLGSHDSVGISARNPEMIKINHMREQILRLARPLLTNPRVHALGTSGENRGQLELVVSADYDCNQQDRQLLLTEVEKVLQDEVPESLRSEFKLITKYNSLNSTSSTTRL